MDFPILRQFFKYKYIYNIYIIFVLSILFNNVFEFLLLGRNCVSINS